MCDRSHTSTVEVIGQKARASSATDRFRDELTDLAIGELRAYADHLLGEIGHEVLNSDIGAARTLAAELPDRRAAKQRGERLVALTGKDLDLIGAAHTHVLYLLFNET